MDYEDMLECYDPSSIQQLLALTPILAGAFVTLWASRHFAKTISQHAAVVSSCGLSGRAAARHLLDACGLHQVTVEQSANRDCYDRASRQVRLSPDNYQSAAISALAVAAHEVGHAQQFATDSLISRAIPVVHVVFYGLMGVALAVMVLGFTTIPLSVAGLLLLAVGVVSLTLQTAVVVMREIDATRRAMKLAHDADLLATASETEQCRQVLRSASLTYVALMLQRWLGLIGVACALIFLGNMEATLDDEFVGEYPTQLQIAEADGGLRPADYVVSSPLVPMPPMALPQESEALRNPPDTSLPRQISSLPPSDFPSQDIDGQWQNVVLPWLTGMSVHDRPSVFETVLHGVVHWSGLIALIGSYLALGWIHKKWTAPQKALKRNQSGVNQYAQGKYEAAVKQFTKALRIDPKLATAYHNRGTAFRELDRLDQAFADFDMAVRLEPGMLEAILCRGGIWFTRGKQDRALDDFNQVIRLAPECAEALAMRGRIRLDRLEFEQAESDFEQALACDQNQPVPHWGRGVIRLGAEKYDQAFDEFTKALACSAEFSPAWRDRGLSRYLMGRYQDAIADLDEAIRLAPTDAVAWNNRGAARLKLGDYAAADCDLGQAIRLDANLPNAYKHLAWMQATCPEAGYRDGRQAVDNALRALELTEWKQTAWFEVLAAAYAEEGDLEKVAEWRDKASEAGADVSSLY